jgi:hypothetical protein
MAASRAETIYVDSDGSGDYPTIQEAIDRAVSGDEIILLPGRFTGPGNFNLNFRGKAVTVKSLDPRDKYCICKTIIDAQGQGVIARFINDEGPDTIFEGFTLGAGDIHRDLRGDPGFFEFSMKARPTTRYLRNEPIEIIETSEYEVTDYNFICPGIDNPPRGRIWDGLNPFLQPANTTNYHGSGDVNLDGQLTAADAIETQKIISGENPFNIRADVNGDGIVNNTDLDLLNQALSGGTLGAWWNQLTTKQQRDEWIDKFMSLDRTDEHIYHSSFFVCHHFAYQTYVHGAFERDDFAVEGTEYDGGQTIYNLPVYHVLVSTPTNHAINGILVGDDPLDFNDWRFLEPQNDTDVSPGGWNMRYGSELSVGNRYNGQGDMVRFDIDVNGCTLTYFNEDFILIRPEPNTTEPDNRKDCWHPVIIPHGGTGLLFFEKMREDMSRTTDIHVTNVSQLDCDEAPAITGRFHFSRLLDVTRAPDGSIHLLFESKSETDQQNLFHGIYDPVNHILSEVSQVDVNQPLRLATMGRIEVADNNEVFVFWFENYGYSGSYEMGIHWTKSTDTGWQIPQLLTGMTRQGKTGDWVNRNFAWHTFDTEIMNDGRIMLMYLEKEFPNIYISQFIYNGTWTNTRIEDTGWSYSAQGIGICKSRDGTIHMAYWRGDEPEICYIEGGDPEEGRGDVYHRYFDGTSWSSPVLIDNTGQGSEVRLAAGCDNTVYMIWERRVDDTVDAVWNFFEDGAWHQNEIIPAPESFDIWYPTVTALADGRVIAAYSARNDDLVTIGTSFLKSFDVDFNLDGKVNFSDYRIFSKAWLTKQPDPLYNPLCDICAPWDQIDCRDLGAFAGQWLWGYSPITFTADFNGDLRVNYLDYALMAQSWQSQPGDAHWKCLCDISGPPDDKIDLRDLFVLCSAWLQAPLPEPEYFEEDFETGDFSRYDWQHTGNAPWSVVSDQGGQGNYSAKSGIITHSQTSSLEIEIDCAGTRVVFYKKVSSEEYFDYLRFYIDGVKEAEWSGEQNWTEANFNITPVLHTFKWSYEKDSSISNGFDCAWIDHIRIQK